MQPVPQRIEEAFHEPAHNNAQRQEGGFLRVPDWCLGYLSGETHVVDGRLKPKRVFASLGTSDWTAAEQEVAWLYERGTVPPIQPEAPVIDDGAITVRYAGQRYLESRTGASLDPIELDTLEHYRSLIEQRLIPYCDTKRVTLIKDLENRDLCSKVHGVVAVECQGG